MASPAVDNGSETTVGFGSWTANLLAVNWSGASREAIETTHMSTTVATGAGWGSRTYIPGSFSDPGEISLRCHFNPDEIPEIDTAAGDITITFPDGGTLVVDAFGIGFEFSDEMETAMECELTFKVSGEVLITPYEAPP